MSSLRDKMYDYEVAPPAGTWQRIAGDLDESQLTNKFPKSLYNTEVTPPPAAWDKIAATLPTPVVTMAPGAARSITWFRYAAAAVIIGLLGFGIFKWANTNRNGGNEAIVSTGDSSKNVPAIVPTQEENIAVTNAEETVAEEPSTDYLAEAKPAKPTKTKKRTYSINEDLDATEAVYAYNEHTPNLADRYVMLLTPNGIVRMSKKLGDLVCCVSGEEQDDDCKDRMKTWQEKLASSPTSATGNFIDILSMVSTLNEL